MHETIQVKLNKIFYGHSYFHTSATFS